ncbi:MAG: hypothetical protein RL172_1094 [Bacteroidota bacterium]|jgi:RNA polymerase sigma factor (sigma-70 family)
MNYPHVSDEKLLQFYLCNSPAALATLTDLYKDKIYSTIFLMVQDKHVAEEIFRDVFITLINQQMAGKTPAEGNFIKWAVQIAQQLCVEYSRQNVLARVMEPGSEKSHRPSAGFNVSALSSHATYYDCHSKIRDMINLLPEQEREVIALSHYGGVGFRDIAERMKCSLTTALDLMKNGLANLRRMMLEKEMVLG